MTKKQYTDIALAVVICNVVQVSVAETTTTPYSIGGKTQYSDYYEPQQWFIVGMTKK